jgi:hypothetical protein
MAKTLVGALTLALLPSALAFQNTSPFFLFSTSNFHDLHDAAFAQSSEVTSQVLGALKDCSSDTYIIVHQPGVSSSDYADRLSAPRLASYMSSFADKHIQTLMAVSEVYQKDAGSSTWPRTIARGLREQCGDATEFYWEVKNADLSGLEPVIESGKTPKVVLITLPSPEGSDRAKTIQQHDEIFERIVNNLATTSKYTVIFTTSPPSEPVVEQAHPSHREPPAYEMESPITDAVNMELKRDTTFSPRANNTQQGGLFEKYQYFTPGLFMAFAAMLPLVLILGVGLNALANLEVSYFAFSKEMGPTNQKKVQ